MEQRHIELQVTITHVGKARSVHECAYCARKILSGEKYTKLTARQKNERFPKTLAICIDHKPGLIPIGVLLND